MYAERDAKGAEKRQIYLADPLPPTPITESACNTDKIRRPTMLIFVHEVGRPDSGE